MCYFAQIRIRLKLETDPSDWLQRSCGDRHNALLFSSERKIESTHFLGIFLGIELLDVRPQILGLLFVLDAGKYHLGAWNLRSRIFDVFLKRLFVIQAWSLEW
jgi:hypothetical protein